jgi:hypothetical protein
MVGAAVRQTKERFVSSTYASFAVWFVVVGMAGLVAAVLVPAGGLRLALGGAAFIAFGIIYRRLADKA